VVHDPHQQLLPRPWRGSQPPFYLLPMLLIAEPRWNFLLQHFQMLSSDQVAVVHLLLEHYPPSSANSLFA
jgi:hypothetical protein